MKKHLKRLTILAHTLTTLVSAPALAEIWVVPAHPPLE